MSRDYMGRAEFINERNASMKAAKKRDVPLKVCHACYCYCYVAVRVCTACLSAFPRKDKASK